MKSLKEYIECVRLKYNIEDEEFLVKISKFFVSNNWFGGKPIIKDKNIWVEEQYILQIEDKIEQFCKMFMSDENEKIKYLHEKLSNIFPKTEKFLKKYIKDVNVDKVSAYYLADFLLTFLSSEIDEATDKEISYLMDDGYDELPKLYGDLLAEFINWVHTHAKTVYQGIYFMNSYYENESNKEAYDMDSYLEILYCFFNQEYIEDNEMLKKAAYSKNYTDTWLFISLHFLCALRNTDIVKLPHPKIPDSPDNILNQIANGEFSDENSRYVLYSIIWYLESARIVPNKTKRISNVADIKLHIPASTEVLIGTLFAAAEAHFQLSGGDQEKSYIRIITRYEDINRYMGEEIGDLFLGSNFHTRATNKSYMQMIYLLTDDILEENDKFKVKGYMLAALARSHKGSYGEFAKTTSIYLKDAKMNGYSPEFVAKEMFERGVLSMIPSMLLKMILGEDYEKLSVRNQTQMIKELNLSPIEVEKSVELVQLNMKQSVKIVKDIFQNSTKEKILEVLHKIGNGEAVSKTNGCLCVVTAMEKICPYSDRQNCTSCEYEISTKTTMMLMAKEYKRLNMRYKNARTDLEKERCKAMAKDVVIPSIEEMLSFLENNYGSDVLKSYEKVISEVV